MNVKIDPDLYKKLKKLDVRIKNSFKEKVSVFVNNPYDPRLRNHKLKKELEGYRSIDITSNYRALYKEVVIRKEIVAYFSLLGTHKELYKN